MKIKRQKKKMVEALSKFQKVNEAIAKKYKAKVSIVFGDEEVVIADGTEKKI